MAFPLKSGADLYNQQLIRAAIWNYSAEIIDPKEYATGLMYFNTNPGSNLYQKLRFRTGTEWKTIAFEEDLDMANNADFKALEDKVKLLAGEVDTDAIISNMKEVSNFLAGFAEDANLMSVLDGKLDKTGGTITGDLILNSPNSDYALHFQTGLGAGWIGFQADRDRWFVTNRNWSADYALLHSGNIGDYAVKIDGSSRMKAEKGLKWDSSEGGNSDNFDSSFFVGRDASADSTLATSKRPYTAVLNVGGTVVSGYRFQLASYVGPTHNELYYRGYNNNGSEWKDWKTIAFTDSNVASAQALVHSNGTVGATVRSNGIISISEYLILKNSRYCMATLSDGTTERNILGVNSDNNLLVGYGSRWDGKTLIYGDGIECIIKDTPTMLINSSGNVTIGSEDKAGTSTKLYVNGNAKIEVGNRLHIFADNVFASYDKTIGGFYMYGGIREGEALSCEVAGVGGSWVGAGFKLMQNGNFGIGLTPSAQLHVAQDIVANGTIACKGIAAEGSEVGMGTVDKKVLYISSSTTQQTFSLTHGLNTREITVCIYEVTSTGTNMILTDVEITGDNTISVSFGNPPTENHMVVVMG